MQSQTYQASISDSMTSSKVSISVDSSPYTSLICSRQQNAQKSYSQVCQSADTIHGRVIQYTYIQLILLDAVHRFELLWLNTAEVWPIVVHRTHAAEKSTIRNYELH